VAHLAWGVGAVRRTREEASQGQGGAEGGAGDETRRKAAAQSLPRTALPRSNSPRSCPPPPPAGRRRPPRAAARRARARPPAGGGVSRARRSQAGCRGVGYAAALPLLLPQPCKPPHGAARGRPPRRPQHPQAAPASCRSLKFKTGQRPPCAAPGRRPRWRRGQAAA
jgi:hypothetical protein